MIKNDEDETKKMSMIKLCNHNFIDVANLSSRNYT